VQTRTRAMTVEKETFVKLMKVGSFVPEECVLSALRRSVAHLFSPSLICSPCLPPLSSLTFALSLSPVDHPLCLCVCVSVHLRFSLSLSPLTQTRFSTIRNKNTKKHTIKQNKHTNIHKHNTRALTHPLRPLHAFAQLEMGISEEEASLTTSRGDYDEDAASTSRSKSPRRSKGKRKTRKLKLYRTKEGTKMIAGGTLPAIVRTLCSFLIKSDSAQRAGRC
jgi:hypothetical protein